MYTLIKSGRPGYLFDELQFSQSRRLFNILVPAHRTAARASSFLFMVQFFGTACRQKSEEWVALISSWKVVCHICSVLRAVVVVIIMIIMLVFNNN
jgi:hypothetical protein